MGLGRSAVYSVHAVLLFISGLLIFVGLMVPRWQEIQFRQSGDIHHHGLFEDCSHAYREDASTQWTCTFKDFSTTYGSSYGSQYRGTGGGSGIAFDPNGPGHHDNAPFRLEIIAMLVIAVLLDMLALGLVFVACCFDRADKQKGMRVAAAIAALLEFLSVILSGGAVIYFTRMAYLPQYRTAVEAGQTVREQQNFGVAFYTAVIGAVIGIFAFLVSVLAAIMAFMSQQSGVKYRGFGAPGKGLPPVHISDIGNGKIVTVNSSTTNDFVTTKQYPPDVVENKDNLVYVKSKPFPPDTANENLIPVYEADKREEFVKTKSYPENNTSSVVYEARRRQQELIATVETSPQMVRNNSMKMLNSFAAEGEEVVLRVRSESYGSSVPQMRSSGSVGGQFEQASNPGSVTNAAGAIDYFQNTPV